MKVAIPYRRFSSKKQAIGSSEHRQEVGFETFVQQSELPASNDEYWDKGESAYHGDHRTKEFGRLLADCQAKKWDKGSVIWVEDMDRFGRGVLAVVLGDWATITNAGYGIHVASLGTTYTKHTDQMELMGVILKSILAHDESKKKSDRKKADWKKKRETANGLTKNGKKSKACPYWVSVSEDGKTYQLNDRATTLRQACLMAIEGHTQYRIAYTLKITNNGLTRTFRDRCLIGEYQPQTRDHGERKNVGNPIENYYPAVLTMDEFRSLQNSLNKRVFAKQKKTRCVSCLFTGLVSNEKGEELRIKRNSAGRPDYLTPFKDGNFSSGKSVHYPLVERMLLNAFMGLTRSDLFPTNTNTEQQEIRELDAKIEDLKGNLAKWKLKAVESDDADIFDIIISIKGRITELTTRKESLETKLVVAKCDTLAVAHELITEILGGLTGIPLLDARAKLKDLILGIVKRIELKVWNTNSFGLKVEYVNGRESGLVCVLEGLAVAQSNALNMEW